MKKLLLFLLIIYALILCLGLSFPVIFEDEVPLTAVSCPVRISRSETLDVKSINLNLNYTKFHLSDPE